MSNFRLLVVVRHVDNDPSKVKESVDLMLELYLDHGGPGSTVGLFDRAAIMNNESTGKPWILPTSELPEDYQRTCYGVITPSGHYPSKASMPWLKEHQVDLELPPLEWLKQEGNWAAYMRCHT